MSDPFNWQRTRIKPLTQHAHDALNVKYDHFGRTFNVGDRVLQVVLMSSKQCCGFRQLLVPIHEQSIPVLEKNHTYYVTKMGIPRYVLNT